MINTDRRYADNYIVLSTHSDYKVENLFINNVSWIKNNYDVVLVECVPANLKNQDVIDTLINNVVSHSINLSRLSGVVKDLTNEHITLMKRPCAPDEDKLRSFQARGQVLSLVYQHYSHYRNLETLGATDKLFTNFLRIAFFQKALAAGLEIRGCEPESYAILQTDMKVRDNEIWNSIKKCSNEGKRVFVNLGAFHGINVLENLEKTALKTGKTAVIQLSVNHPTEDFDRWKRSVSLQRFALPHLKFASTVIQSRISHEVQSEMFKIMASFDINNHQPHDYYSRGLALYRDKDYVKALAHLFVSLAIYKEGNDQPLNSAVCLSTIASCYRDMGKLEVAAQACNEALKLLSNGLQTYQEAAKIQKKLDAILQMKPAETPQQSNPPIETPCEQGNLEVQTAVESNEDPLVNQHVNTIVATPGTLLTPRNLLIGAGIATVAAVATPYFSRFIWGSDDK